METALGSSAGWEHYPHGADIGLRGIGPSRECAFEQAALALTAVITDPHLVKPLKHVVVSVTEPDPELLLAKWLNAVIFEMAVERMLFSRFSVRLDGSGLQAASGASRSISYGICRRSR